MLVKLHDVTQSFFCQVDVRDVSTGEPIPFTESNGKYLVKVEPLNAVRVPSELYVTVSYSDLEPVFCGLPP